ncbi:MAG: hypothetical protein WC816_11895 [Sphingomonas sp.]|jgi:hypothetical protein
MGAGSGKAGGQETGDDITRLCRAPCPPASDQLSADVLRSAGWSTLTAGTSACRVFISIVGTLMVLASVPTVTLATSAVNIDKAKGNRANQQAGLPGQQAQIAPALFLSQSHYDVLNAAHRRMFPGILR